MKIFTLKQFRAKYDELGLAKTLVFIMDRVLRALDPASGFYLYQFVAQPLAEQPRLAPNRGKAFSFRLISTPDPLLLALGRPAAVIAQRFAQGAQCLAALKDEQLVGCIWFVRGQYAEDEVRVDYRLPAGNACVWDFDVFVVDSHRFGLLFPKLWDAFDACLRAEGAVYTVSRFNRFNRFNRLNQHSLTFHHQLGAADCGWATFLRLASFELMVSNLAPYLSAGRLKRQVLHLKHRDEARGK